MAVTCASTGPTLSTSISRLWFRRRLAHFSGLLKNILLPWINGHELLMNPSPIILNTPILWSQWCGNSLHPPWGSQFWGPGQGWWDVLEPSSTAGQGPKQRSFRHEEIYCIYIYTHTSSTAQGGGGSFKNRRPIGEVGCCESRMAERSHWLIERWLMSPLFLSLCFSLSLIIYLPTYLPIYLSIYQSI